MLSGGGGVFIYTWGYPHVQVHVQVVVMRDEGFGGGASGDHVHHRSLNLKETQVVQELAHVRNNFGTGVELIPEKIGNLSLL